MSTPLKVLLVDHSQGDAERILKELRQGGWAPDCARMGTPSELRAALGRDDWELIIFDHAAPGFGAAEALRLVRERGLDAPFLVVSDALGEDNAVALLRAG